MSDSRAKLAVFLSIVLTLANAVFTSLNLSARHRNYDAGWDSGYVAAVDSVRFDARDHSASFYMPESVELPASVCVGDSLYLPNNVGVRVLDTAPHHITYRVTRWLP